MFKNRIPFRFKETVPPLLAVVFFLCLSVFFLVPKAKEAIEITKKVKQQEAEIKKLKEKFADLNAISEQELTGSADLLLLALPAKNDFYFFLTKVKKAFELEGMKISSFKLDPGLISTQSAESKEEENFGIKILFFAPFSRIQAIIPKLENTLPPVTIDSLKMFSPGASVSAEPQTLSVEMNVLCFFSPLPKFLGKVDSLLPKTSSRKKELLEQFRKKEVLVSGEMTFEPGAVSVGRENPFPE